MAARIQQFKIADFARGLLNFATALAREIYLALHFATAQSAFVVVKVMSEYSTTLHMKVPITVFTGGVTTTTGSAATVTGLPFTMRFCTALVCNTSSSFTVPTMGSVPNAPPLAMVIGAVPDTLRRFQHPPTFAHG